MVVLTVNQRAGKSVAVGSVNIPASSLRHSNSFLEVSVSNGWWVTNLQI